MKGGVWKRQGLEEALDRARLLTGTLSSRLEMRDIIAMPSVEGKGK